MICLRDILFRFSILIIVVYKYFKYEHGSVNAILTIVDMFTNRVHLFPISSDFYQSIFKSLNVRSRLTVAMHQQANRRVENRNKLIETYLRLYIIENSQWPTLLPIAGLSQSQPLTSLDHKSSSEVDLGYVP